MAVDFNHHISLRSSSLFLVCHHSPQSKVISLLVADDAQLLSERDDALHDLLLHEVEAHGEHGHPEEDVHEAEQELRVPRQALQTAAASANSVCARVGGVGGGPGAVVVGGAEGCTRHDVSEADRAENV